MTEEGDEPSGLPPAARRQTSGKVSPDEVEAEAREAQARLARARADDAETDSSLRRWLGFGALGVMAIQLLIANTAFFWYGIANHWHIPVAAINVWLGATVVEVVVIVHTVARYLFSARDHQIHDRTELLPSPTLSS